MKNYVEFETIRPFLEKNADIIDFTEDENTMSFRFDKPLDSNTIKRFFWRNDGEIVDIINSKFGNHLWSFETNFAIFPKDKKTIIIHKRLM